MSNTSHQILVVTGPTCSGKTAFAVEAAKQLGGSVINADSMQVYKDLHVITARPTEQETGGIEHRLFGVLDGSDACSVARWVDMAAVEIRDLWQNGVVPILSGGTGMYLKALMQGIADIPDIPPKIHVTVKRILDEGGQEALYAHLQGIDPVMAARLQPGDTQRIQRAAEVMDATGISLAEWQEKPLKPPLPEAEFEICAMEIDRMALYEKINQRFLWMMDHGAIEEVEALRQRHLPADLPIMRAHGVPELMAFLEGAMTREEAIRQAQKNTRHYAKRQLTWLRHQMEGVEWVNPLAMAG